MSRILPRVERQRPWVFGGLGIQIVGAGIPTAYVLSRLRRQGVGGHLTAASVRLFLRQEGHTGLGLGLLILGTVIFATGSVVMARPFVRRRVDLLVAVPLAATAGVLVLGLAAAVVALILAAWNDGFDPPEIDWPRKRRPRRRGGPPPL